MQNLIPSNKDAFTAYKEACSNKKNVGIRTRLSDLDDVIKGQAETFDKLFVANKLENIAPHNFDSSQRKDLLGLYSFQGSIIKTIRNGVDPVY